MKIINLQTNAEPITVSGSAADVCAGCSVDLGNLAAVVRGSTYSDNATNSFSVVIQPGTVNLYQETQPIYEWAQGFNVGLVIAPCLVLILLYRKYFARGDAFD